MDEDEDLVPFSGVHDCVDQQIQCHLSEPVLVRNDLVLEFIEVHEFQLDGNSLLIYHIPDSLYQFLNCRLQFEWPIIEKVLLVKTGDWRINGPVEQTVVFDISAKEVHHFNFIGYRALD